MPPQPGKVATSPSSVPRSLLANTLDGTVGGTMATRPPNSSTTLTDVNKVALSLIVYSKQHQDDPMMDKPLGSLDHLFSSASVVRRRHFMAAASALAATGGASSAANAQAPATAVTEQDREHMRQAIQLMRQAGVVDKTGGPFGAVIVRDGKVLAASGNSVLRDNDPSAHAEVNAIRAACKKVGAANIKGATMYTSCECCPMCYATAYWARVGKIYYAASWTDYADLFDDSNISVDMQRPYPQRTVQIAQLMQSDAQKVWLEYRDLPQKTRY